MFVPKLIFIALLTVRLPPMVVFPDASTVKSPSAADKVSSHVIVFPVISPAAVIEASAEVVSVAPPVTPR